jgi:acyl dehydratase
MDSRRRGTRQGGEPVSFNHRPRLSDTLVLPYLWNQIIEVRNIKMLVNYGMDKMRFGQPVVTGSRLRMTTKLHNIQNLRGICKTEIEFKIEIEGQRKPALEGIASFLYYFI